MILVSKQGYVGPMVVYVVDHVGLVADYTLNVLNIHILYHFRWDYIMDVNLVVTVSIFISKKWRTK